MTYYDKLLFELLTRSVVFKTAIIAIADTQQPMYRAIQKAITNKHIKEKTITLIRNKKKYITDVLIITADGIRYLASKEWTTDFGWLNYIPQSVSRPAILGKKRLGKNDLERFAKIASVAVISDIIGAPMAPIFIDTIGSDMSVTSTAKELDVDDDNWWENDNYELEHGVNENHGASSGVMTLSEIVNSAFSNWKAKEQNENEAKFISPISLSPASHDEYYFYDSVSLKHMIESVRLNTKSSTSINQGRYSGIIDSHFKSVLVYVGTSYGLSWREWNYESEIAAQSLFNKSFSKSDSNSFLTHSSILLVPNAKVFGDIYFDKQGKRKVKRKKNRKEDNNDLGKGFTYMFVVPITNIGVKHMKWLLDNDIEPMKDDLITAAIDSGIYKENQGSARGIFPLQRADSLPIAIGITLDIQEIKTIDKVVTKMQWRKFGILCLEWQVEYYKQIFPQAELMTMTL